MQQNCIKLVLVFLLFICTIAVSAQVKFYAKSSDTKLAKNAVLQVDFIIENATSIKDLMLPEFKNFVVLSGPNQSNSSTSINGKNASSYTITYLLQPITNGSFNIPAATAVVDGKLMKTGALSIKVVGVVANNNTSTLPVEEVAEDYLLKPGENIKDKINRNILVLLDVDKTVCYEGEPVVATYKLCTRLRSESKVTRRPSLNGFSVYDMLPPEGNAPTIEKINGKPYNVHIIRKVQLYPLQPGSFELDAVELENTIHFLKSNATANGAGGMQQLLDDVMPQGEWVSHDVSLSCKPVTITVKPLPAVKPAGFNGAVGSFTIEAALQTTAPIQEGDVVPYMVTIKGAGNLPVLVSPVISFAAGMYAEDPIVKEDLDKTIAPINGSKTFYYNLSVDKKGEYEIPVVEFSFFNPTTKKFVTTATKPLTIHVMAGTKEKKNVTNEKTKSVNSEKTKAGSSKNIYWILPVTLLLMAGLFLISKKKNTTTVQVATVAANVFEAEPLPTPKIDFFEEPRKLLNFNDDNFYSALHKSIWNNIADIVQQPTITLNKNNMTEKLFRQNVSTKSIETLKTILQQVEMALYIPTDEVADKQQLLADAEMILNSIRQQT